MDRRVFLSAALLFPMAARAGAMASDPAALSQPSGATNLMPAFFEIYQKASAAADLAGRVEIIGRQFLLPNAEVYTSAGFNGGSHGRFNNSRVAKWLTDFDPIADRVRSMSDGLPNKWAEHERRFRKEFPRYVPRVATWFLPSLFSFDGFTQRWNGEPRLFFGIDTIARRRGSDTDLAVLFDHESFHLLHLQVNPSLGANSLWTRTWREGLATFASGLLNPKARRAEILMSPELASLPSSEEKGVAIELLDHLDEQGSSSERRLFDADKNEGSGRSRIGYLVASHVAQLAHEQLSLVQMIELDPARARSIVISGLSRIAQRPL